MTQLISLVLVVCVLFSAAPAVAQTGSRGGGAELWPETRADYDTLTFDQKLMIYRSIARDERLAKLRSISIRDILEGNREARGYEELYRWLPISQMDLFKIENLLLKHEVMVPKYYAQAHRLWLKVHFAEPAKEEDGDENATGEELKESRIADLKATVGTNINAATGFAPPPDEYQGEIQIAVNKQNTDQMVAGANTWNTLCGYGMQDVFYSSDGGATWGYTCTPVGTDYSVLSGYSCDYEFGSDPAIYWNNSDEVFFEYMAICYKRVGAQYREHYAMVVAKSLDGGATWQPYSVLQNSWDDYRILEDKNFYVIDNNSGSPYAGRHYSCWDRNNDELFKYSTDGGSSWNEVDLPDTPTLDLGCELTVEDDGTVHVIFDTLTCTTYCTDEDMYYTRSTNGGASWSSLVHLRDFTNVISFGLQGKPDVQDERGINPFGAIDVDNTGGACDGYLYVCFTDDPDGSGADSADIFVVRSTNGGDTWDNLGSPVQVNDDDPSPNIQFHPFLVVDQTSGDVLVAWHDARNDSGNKQVDYFIARSTDCGATFEANIQVSQPSAQFNNSGISFSNMNTGDNANRNPNQYAEYMGLDAHNGTAYVAWADTRHYFPSSTSESEKDNMGFATVEFTTTCSPLSCTGITAVADPVCEGTAHVLTAGYSGGVSSYTVEWDLDNDGQYDDFTGNPVTHTFSAGSHTVGVRVTDSCSLGAQTCTSSTTVEVDAAPSQPVIGTIWDEDECAQSGIHVPYTAGSPVDHHELVRGVAVVDASYTSNELYNPGSTATFDYTVRAVNGACSTDSAAKSFADASNTPGAPTITGITDLDSCAQSGIQVFFTAGAGATRHVLVGGAVEVADPYTSGQTHDPGDTATYQYSVRAYNGSCSADSGQLAGTDSDDCSCTTAPTFAGLESVTPITGTSACGLTLSWSAPSSVPCSGTVVYNVYRSTDSGFTPDPATNLIASCVTGTTYDDTSVAVDQIYYYVIRAEDATSWGSGPCNSGNEDDNLVRLSGMVSTVNRTGAQVTSPITASDSTSSSSLTSVDVVSATSATLIYDTSYTGGSGTTETANQTTSPINAKNGTRTSTLTPAFSIPALSADSATVSWTLTGTTLLTQCAAIRLRAPDGTETTLKAAGVADTGSANVLSFYQAEAPGTYTIVLQELLGCGPNSARAYLADTTMVVVDLGGGGGTDWTTNVEVWFIDPLGAATQLKGLGDSDSGSWPVLSYYIGAGAYQVRLVESGGGTAELSNAELQVDGTTCSTEGVADVEFFTATGGFDGVGTRQMVLEWVNPYTGSSSGYTTKVCVDTSDYPADPTSCAELYAGAPASGAYDSHTYTAGLSAGQIYYYTAFVVRDVGGVDHYSAGSGVFARALDLSTGDVKWAFSTGASALAPPGLGSVYGVSNDRNLHSMMAGSDGGDWPTTWTPKAMNAPAQGRPPVVTFPAGTAFDDAKVAFLGSQDGYVYAVDADSGSVLWERDLGAMVQAAPAGIFSHWDWGPEPHYDLVLVGTREAGADNTFFARDAGSGDPAWDFSGDGTHGAIGIISGSAAVDYEAKRVWFASRERSDTDDTTLWCLQFTDSSASVVWAKALGDIDGGPSLRGGVIYVGTNASRVWALDADTGDYIWPSPYYHDCSDGPVKSFVSPDHGSDDLYLSTSTTVWGLTDGGVAGPSVSWWTNVIDAPSVPLFAPGSTLVYVGSGDGLLYELDVSGGPDVALERLGSVSSPSAVGSPALDVMHDLVYVGTEEGIVYAVSVPLS